MSAYQVDYETIGRVLKAISKAGCYGSRYKQIEKLKQQYEKNAGIVFDQLLELNRLSLKGRYENVEGMFFEVDRSKAVWFSRQLGHNDFQLLKSLNCFLYQSCEGDANKTDLYKTIDCITNNYSSDLVTKSVEYQNATWG
tara:strand:- start:43 stop:462 length:420 start_codon:yes stop_codon:yes gene_type:complete